MHLCEHLSRLCGCIYDFRHQSLISAQAWLPEASVSGAGLELPSSQAKNSLVHSHIVQ